MSDFDDAKDKLRRNVMLFSAIATTYWFVGLKLPEKALGFDLLAISSERIWVVFIVVQLYVSARYYYSEEAIEGRKKLDDSLVRLQRQIYVWVLTRLIRIDLRVGKSSPFQPPFHRDFIDNIVKGTGKPIDPKHVAVVGFGYNKGRAQAGNEFFELRVHSDELTQQSGITQVSYQPWLPRTVGVLAWVGSRTAPAAFVNIVLPSIASMVGVIAAIRNALDAAGYLLWPDFAWLL